MEKAWLAYKDAFKMKFCSRLIDSCSFSCKSLCIFWKVVLLAVFWLFQNSLQGLLISYESLVASSCYVVMLSFLSKHPIYDYPFIYYKISFSLSASQHHQEIDGQQHKELSELNTARTGGKATSAAAIFVTRHRVQSVAKLCDCHQTM